ncbi:MAG: carboxylating nicotinate-nucleotide diphosphorylase [Candidatus Riflebacteria bacterium]|nr:carboxylating nicotinate-nucleotide diphosphorylase [Candidatus Riflebacteria bacterium]
MQNLDVYISEILAEDLGPGVRDVSVFSLGNASERIAKGRVVAKSDGVISGLWLVEKVLKEVEKFSRPVSMFLCPARVEYMCKDGDFASSGTLIAEINGPVGTLLTSERTILNLLQRLSGVATLTRSFVEAIKGSKSQILDTRKTTPGMRSLEKLAVRHGGGMNHRFGLYDMVMLKDNHITAMGGKIKSAISNARQLVGPTLKIEVEVANLVQFEEALNTDVDMIMLDNMTPSEMKKCVEIAAGKVPLEASGGITLESVKKVAETGVDYISVGALTHSAKALDISMKISF